MNYLETILESRLFDAIDKKEYSQALKSLVITSRKYKKEEFIFCEEEEIKYICIPRGGKVKSEKYYPSGNIHIIEMIEEGSVFGVEIACSRSRQSYCDFVAESDCEIVFISIHSIYASPYVKEFSYALNHMIADENIKKINKTFILAENRLRERVMAYFSILYKKSGCNEIQIDMNREQLSDFLCVNRSALSYELNKMKREGLIDFHKNRFCLHYIK